MMWHKKNSTVFYWWSVIPTCPKSDYLIAFLTNSFSGLSKMMTTLCANLSKPPVAVPTIFQKWGSTVLNRKETIWVQFQDISVQNGTLKKTVRSSIFNHSKPKVGCSSSITKRWTCSSLSNVRKKTMYESVPWVI